MSKRIIFSSTFNERRSHFAFVCMLQIAACALCYDSSFYFRIILRVEEEKNKCMKGFQAQTVKQKRNETRISYSLRYLEFEHSAIYGMMANVHSECAWKANAKHSGLYQYYAHYTLYPLYPHTHIYI